MLYIENQTESKIDKELLEKIVKELTNKDIELLIVDNQSMKELNKTYRGIDKSTDVLSFPLEDIPNAPLGSIVINQEKVLELSSKLKHSQKSEYVLLFIHGLLHLLGYDHEKDNGEMREKEKELIEKFDLPQSLIVRTK